MRSFFEKFMIFMQGRYGLDTLGKFLLCVSLIIWFVGIFVFSFPARLIIRLLNLALIGYIIFRALSMNIVKRSAENRAFLKVYNPVKAWCKLTWQKIRDRKDFRYIKCPVCKAQLRVKNKKGRHTVSCPKCKSEFEKKI